MYSACVLGTLLYGSETWTTYQRHERKLHAFHMRCLRRILGISWRDRVSNVEVLDRADIPSMCQLLRERRLRWLGHVHRMSDGRLPKDILYGELTQGKRGRGRPMLRFKDVCRRDMLSAGIDPSSWESVAGERSLWRRSIRNQAADIPRRKTNQLPTTDAFFRMP